MLIDAKPPKPPGKIRRFLPLPVLLLLILVVMTVAGFLTYQCVSYIHLGMPMNREVVTCVEVALT